MEHTCNCNLASFLCLVWITIFSGVMNLPTPWRSSGESDHSSAAMWNSIELEHSLNSSREQNFNQFYYQKEGAESKVFTYACSASFTEEAEVNEPHKPFNQPQGMLRLSHYTDSFEQFLHCENVYWLCRCITSPWGENSSKKLERVNYNKFYCSS